MKTLIIRVYGSKRPPVHVRVQPGIRECDVLFHLKISDHVLVPAGTEDLAIEIFKHLNPSQDDFYERVSDGDKFVAIPAYEAARLAYADMRRKASPKETK